MGIYTPKISPSKFLWGKNDVRTAIQQFYTPKLLYPAKTYFWLRPCSLPPGELGRSQLSGDLERTSYSKHAHVLVTATYY